jgi:predicted transcriptional regulator
MTERVVLIEPGTTLRMAAIIITQAQLDVLLVADLGTVIGMVDERRIVSGSMGTYPERKTVADVMFDGFLWLRDDDDLEFARRQVLASRARVAVVRNARANLVGTLHADESPNLERRLT